MYDNSQIRNDEIVKQINDALIVLKKDINRNKNSENENPKKILLKKSSILITNKKLKYVHVARVGRLAKVSERKVLTVPVSKY